MSDFRNLPLNPLRAFAIASRYKTFTATAKHMGVSQVAISRQIAILENYLGVKLFERDTRSVKLTEIGRRFGQDVSVIFDDLEDATNRLLTDETENTIHVRVYPTFANHWLLPRISDFYDRYPESRLRLDTTVQPLDFRGTHLDAAIQLGGGAWRDAKCRKLFDEDVDVFCSPGYADQLGDPASGNFFQSAELLHSKYRRSEWPDWAKEHDYEIDLRSGSEFESSLLSYSAARQGLGLVVGQTHLLQDEIDRGELVRPLMKPVQTGSAFYVIWPTMTSVATKTRRFIDWLLEVSDEPPEFFKKR